MPETARPNVSRFAPETSVAQIREMIEATVTRGLPSGNTRGRSGTIYELDIGQLIGVDIRGHPSSRLRVVVNESNQIVTAFPC